MFSFVNMSISTDLAGNASVSWSTTLWQGDTDMLVPNTTNQAPVNNNTESSQPAVWSLLDKLFILSNDQRQLADSIQEPLRHVLVAIAIPLMLCKVIVFAQKSMRSASACYVIALNCGQLFYVTTNTVVFIWLKLVNPPEYFYCLFLAYAALYGGVLVAKRGAYVVMCLASIERLYAVLRPLHVKNFLFAKRPVVSVVVVYTLTALFHLYRLTKSKIVMVYLPSAGRSCSFVPTEIYLKHQEVNDFVIFLAKIIFEYSSLALQLALNVLTIWALRRHNMATKDVQSSTNEDAKRKQERQLTITLLGASASYLLLSLPAAFFNVFQTTDSKFAPRGRYRHLYYVMEDFSYNMSVLGGGIDFFCYLGLSTKYRKTVRHLLRCKRKRFDSFFGRQRQPRMEERPTENVTTEISSTQTT